MTVASGVLAGSSQAWASSDIAIQPPDNPAIPPMNTVTMLVLALVIQTPNHGYELARIYKQRYERILPADEKAIYPALKRLEARGWVQRAAVVGSSSWRRSRRMVCHPTLEGIVAHKRWLSAPENDADWHTELVAKISTAEKLWVSEFLQLIERYERRVINEAERIERELCTAGASLPMRLVLEEQRLTVVARSAWVKVARREINGVG